MKEKKCRVGQYLLMLSIAILMVVTVKVKALAKGSVTIEGNSYATSASGKGWSYNADSNTLTLNGFNYNGKGHGIYCAMDSTLKIVLEGNNSITSTEIGILVIYRRDDEPTLEFTGNGSLNVTSMDSTAISTVGSLTIDGCTITATTQTKYGGGSAITVGQNLIIKNATVTATASNKSGRSVYGLAGSMLGSSENGNYKIVITDSKVTATSETPLGSGIYNKYGDIEIGRNADFTATGVDNGIKVASSLYDLKIDSDVKSVVAIGEGGAMNLGGGKLKNAVPGIGWTNTAGTKGESAIDISPAEGRSIGYDLKKVLFTTLFPTITTAPTALEPVFDSSEHELVTAGRASNGTMQYALGTNSTTAPSKSLFSTAIPTGVDVGTYYVWYRAYGNAGYGSTTPKCITVTIYKEKPAPDPTPTPGPNQEDDKKQNSSSTADQVRTSESDTNKTAENLDQKQKSTKLSKITAGKKSFTITWKKQTAKGIKGYEIQYSTDKGFKEDATKTVSINKTKTTSKTIKKLKSKTKYYVKIRTFSKKNGVKVYSKWSKYKTVKTK